MTNFDSIDLEPEALLDQLERLKRINWPAQRSDVAASRPLQLLDDLREQCHEHLGNQSESLQPRFAELQTLLAPLFPQPPPTQLSDKEQNEVRQQVESLCEELEDILYALSLRQV